MPIRCFSCNKVVGNLWEKYKSMIGNNESDDLDDDISNYKNNDNNSNNTRDNNIKEQVLDKLGLVRYCCRRMLLTHVDNMDELIQYEQFNSSVLSRPGITYISNEITPRYYMAR